MSKEDIKEDTKESKGSKRFSKSFERRVKPREDYHLEIRLQVKLDEEIFKDYKDACGHDVDKFNIERLFVKRVLTGGLIRCNDKFPDAIREASSSSEILHRVAEHGLFKHFYNSIIDNGKIDYVIGFSEPTDNNECFISEEVNKGVDIIEEFLSKLRNK